MKITIEERNGDFHVWGDGMRGFHLYVKDFDIEEIKEAIEFWERSIGAKEDVPAKTDRAA